MKFQLVKLGNLCKVQSGGTPRRGVDDLYGGNIPWAKIGDIENAQNGYIFNTAETITPAGLESINNRLFPENTVFLAMYGSVGKTAIAGMEMTTNQAILGLQPNSREILHYRYLKYWLDYSKKDLIKKARGVALQNISATIVKEFEIPLPTLEDQKRIVKILDQADALRHKRKQSIELLDDYLKSVFLEMFGDPEENSKQWPKLVLKDAVDIQSGQVSPKIEPFASMIHIGGADIQSGTGKIIRKILAKNAGQISGKYLFDEQYLLYSKIRPNLNKVSLPNFKGICSADIYPIKPRESLNKYFLAYILKSDGFLSYAVKNSGRANIPKINRLDLLKYKIIVPPINLQNLFEKNWQKVELIKQKMLMQSVELEAQFQVLMQNIFGIVN